MAISDQEVQFLSALVAKQTGNVISASQAYLVESRLRPVAERAGIQDIHSLVAELRRSNLSPLHQQVAEAMTINETHFFRDPDLFDAIADHTIPELIASRESKRSLRIWCAACSSGQEPYSLAILLRSRFPQLNTWDIRITATDYSAEMVSKCESGSYSQFEVNRGLPASLLVQNFDRKDLDWVIKPEIRRQIEFRELNLMSPLPFHERFDLVLMRNVLIYFDPKTKTEILTRAHRAMQPDGFLFLGGGESMVNISAPFERQMLNRSIGFRPNEYLKAASTSRQIASCS